MVSVRQQPHSYAIPIAVSLLLHLLLIPSILLILKYFKIEPTLKKSSPPPVLTIMQPKPAEKVPPTPLTPKATAKQRFLDTADMAEFEKPPEKSPFISEKNTRLASREQGTLDKPLPTLAGINKPGITVAERPDSLVKPDKPVPAQAPSPQTPEQQASQEVQKQTQPKPVVESTPRNLPQSEDGLFPTLEKKEEPKPKADNPSKPTKAAKAVAPTAPFSFRQDKTALRGGAAQVGDTSIESQATPEGKYKALIYRTIGSQWRFMVYKQSALLNYGTVLIRFEVRRDGSLASLTVLKNESESTMLQTISETAIRLCAPFPPMPDNLKQQYGDTIPLDVNFSIY